MVALHTSPVGSVAASTSSDLLHFLAGNFFTSSVIIVYSVSANSLEANIKINDKAAALVREAADAVLFARFETELVKTNGKTRAYGEGNRIMYTESRPGWDAK